MELKEQILTVMKTWSDEKWESLIDGHGIFHASDYTDIFNLPKEFVEPLDKTHKSDGSWTGSNTTPDGKILATVEGVYNLELLESLKELFHIKTRFYYGRGRNAEQIVKALRELVK